MIIDCGGGQARPDLPNLPNQRYKTMKLVTDSGADLIFPDEVRKAIEVRTLPLVVTLDGKSYREDLDITTERFYDLLGSSSDLPTTSLPSFWLT